MEFDEIAHSVLQDLGKTLGKNVPDYQKKFSILVLKANETKEFFTDEYATSNARFFMRRWLTDLIRKEDPEIYHKIPRRFTLGSAIND